MQKNFVRLFQEIGLNSCFDSIKERQQDDRAYIKSRELASSLLDKMIVTLGDRKGIILDYEAAKNDYHSTEVLWAYWQGLHDCIAVLKWIEQL